MTAINRHSRIPYQSSRGIGAHRRRKAHSSLAPPRFSPRLIKMICIVIRRSAEHVHGGKDVTPTPPHPPYMERMGRGMVPYDPSGLLNVMVSL